MPRKVLIGFGSLLLLAVSIFLFTEIIQPKKSEIIQITYWVAPDTATIPDNRAGDVIRYGRELIANTSQYLGPKGSVGNISNGMNCQNCHLEAGTKTFGNNFSAVASTYPKFRTRSGTLETIEKRINDCLERSLNGKPLLMESREMKAMVSYIKWIGKDVPNGEVPIGAGLLELPYLETAADPTKGQLVYQLHCAQCHGKEGGGIAKTDSIGWVYPSLWGKHSFNDGAGLFRLSKLAGYVKANMPLGRTFNNPQLTNEESWHVAAYITAMPRPTFDKANDWPNIATKPFDHPFGPFADGFDEKQHKFGPFKPILEKRKEQVSVH